MSLVDLHFFFLVVEWHFQTKEFLGDAILKRLAGEMVFWSSANRNEGDLSSLSEPMKSNVHLRNACRREGWHLYLWAKPFVAKSNSARQGQVTLADLRRQPVSEKTQADIMEAIIGAIYESNYHDSRLFPAASDGKIQAFQLFGDLWDGRTRKIKMLDRSKMSAGHESAKETLPPNSLEAAADEILAERMVKKKGRLREENLLPGCRRLVGSNSGLYACALFLDSCITMITREDEQREPALVSPFIELMRRISIVVRMIWIW